ncbi:MAG: hypothetical protein WCK17_17845 [Verrucomicrobiota bacterium]
MRNNTTSEKKLQNLAETCTGLIVTAGVSAEDALAIVHTTLKEARADGWHERKVDEVGGEEIAIKGHILVRNTTMQSYVYKSTLRKKYGLTPSMIEELGEPDKRVPNQNYRSGPRASLYKVERVEAWIEKNLERIKKNLRAKSEFEKLAVTDSAKLFKEPFDYLRLLQTCEESRGK